MDEAAAHVIPPAVAAGTLRPRPARTQLWVGLAVLLLLAAAVWLAGGAGRRLWAPDRAAVVIQDPAVAALVSRCRLAMAGGVCRAMPDSPQASAAPQPGRLFIVGFGEVDGAVVARLNREGEAMCDTVGRVCQSRPGDELCRVARALYP